MNIIYKTDFQLEQCENKIDYKSNLLFMGSCFSDNMFALLHKYKFQAKTNPFGILYNPVSIINALHMFMENSRVDEKDIVKREDVYYCYFMHSKVNAATREALMDKVQRIIQEGQTMLKNASHIILTFGTAFTYTLKSSGRIVANNHKQPAGLFEKKFLHASEITGLLENFLERCRAFNHSARVIFTVSPVRHIKEGFPENAASKGALLSAIYALRQKRKDVYYFPAYEIMHDDLRDYRYYADDLLHPSALAVSYIFEKFKTACIDPACYHLMRETDAVYTAMEHKPFHPEAQSHKAFKLNMLLKVEQLQNENPALDFSNEIHFFRN